LFEELKGGAAFAGYAAGRRLRMHPYFDCHLYFSNSFALLARHLCDFHTKQWGERCSVPVGSLPHAFSAIDSLQECSSLLEELKGSAAFTGYAVGRCLRTHPYFDCCLYFSNLFALLAGHLCEFHTKQRGERCSVPVGCLPHAFLQSIVCRSALHCLKSQRVALLSQDMQQEGAFTFSLLPSEIASIFSIIYNNLVTMKDYFSMLKSSVPLQCTEGLLISTQPNTYIEKTEHFRTASHLVKQRGQCTWHYPLRNQNWSHWLGLLLVLALHCHCFQSMCDGCHDRDWHVGTV
jgi:hypothetical protein